MEGFLLISIKRGRVVEIRERYEDLTIIDVDINGAIEKAVNYNKITGIVKQGDIVLVNTTAVELSLGTGGMHFVICNNSIKEKELTGNGHIMKLRYTPLQIKCLSAEEQSSPYHDKIKQFKDLNNSVIAVGTLHSMLAPVAAMIKWLRPELRINYIMTDGGALPLPFSFTVKELKKKGIIDNTITIGHSFGGDYECVNIYTGLIVAKEVLKSDVTIVTMGPGIVGTGTKYGFSGIEQGYIIDAVNNLKGKSFAIPRISFSDKRNRHKGISHHTITNLSEITYSKTNLVLPILDDYKNEAIIKQIKDCQLDKKHSIVFENGDDIIKALKYYKLDVITMGRDYYKDKEYFISLGAVGKGIINFLANHQ